MLGTCLLTYLHITTRKIEHTCLRVQSVEECEGVCFEFVHCSDSVEHNPIGQRRLLT